MPVLFNIILEVLTRTIRQDKEIKGMQIGKEEVKLSLFSHNMILYIENPKNSTKKTVKINKFKLKGTRSIYKKLLCFYITTTNYQKKS